MDGYKGSDDIVERLEYATQGPPVVDLYWSEAMEMLRDSLVEIKNLREALDEIWCQQRKLGAPCRISRRNDKNSWCQVCVVKDRLEDGW